MAAISKIQLSSRRFLRSRPPVDMKKRTIQRIFLSERGCYAERDQGDNQDARVRHGFLIQSADE